MGVDVGVYLYGTDWCDDVEGTPVCNMYCILNAVLLLLPVQCLGL